MTDSIPCARPLVLVVDDDPVIRMCAAEALGEIGFAVETVEDGESALVAAERTVPDMILLDIKMPGIDGFETCRRLRALEATRETPIVVATALTDSGTIDRAFEVGATDFIGKPLDFQLLQHRVRFLIRAGEAFGDLNRSLADLNHSQHRLADAQRIAHIGHWEFDPETDEMLWSEELARILHFEPDACFSPSILLDLVHPEDRAAVEKGLESVTVGRKTWGEDHRIRTANGSERIVHHQVERSGNVEGGGPRVVGTIQDLTERKRAEERIRYLAYHDTLTNLPNRNMLRRHLQRLIEYSEESPQQVALLCLDLDRFKRINDTLGYATGDEVLRAMANRLLECVRATDYVERPTTSLNAVSRLGGDEFTIVLTGIREISDIEAATRRILRSLSEPYLIGGQHLVMNASVGIATFPHDAIEADALLAHADSAMSRAKEHGGATFRFFDLSMNDDAERRLRLENGLRVAIREGELEVHYQPQIDARTGEFVGAEGLLRWTSREHGPIPPSEFIGLAEESGMIAELGEWVLRQVCEQAKAWQREGLPPIRMAVNVSSYQLRRGDIVDVVQRALSDFDLEPRHLELELTESALLGDEPEVVRSLDQLRAMNVGIALDDFGTGYSSLSHLIRFPITHLKIDGAFTRELGSRERSHGIVAAVIAMAQRLMLQVTAECVETLEQQRVLCEEGCDLLQGYLLAKPMPPEELASMLRSRCKASPAAAP